MFSYLRPVPLFFPSALRKQIIIALEKCLFSRKAFRREACARWASGKLMPTLPVWVIRAHDKLLRTPLFLVQENTIRDDGSGAEGALTVLEHGRPSSQSARRPVSHQPSFAHLPGMPQLGLRRSYTYCMLKLKCTT